MGSRPYVLAAFAFFGCAKVDLDALVFTCMRDEDCARGLSCHRRDQICVAPDRLAYCGDGAILAGSEACDDGNDAGGDGCSASCAVEARYVCTGTPSRCSRCGDGELGGDETCDDGNRDGGDGCDADCAIEPGWNCGDNRCSLCGNGILESVRESCDYGDAAPGDGCSDVCFLEPGWSCDDAGCFRCGNGIRERDEVCDHRDACPRCDRVSFGWACEGELGRPNTCTQLQFRQISAGVFHTCGVTIDDRVYCAGSNLYPGSDRYFTNQANVPPHLPPIDRVTGGGSVSCGITLTRTATCWGSDYVLRGDSVVFGGQRTPPANLGEILEISAGAHHVCARVAATGATRCWGYDRVARTRGSTVAFTVLSSGNVTSCGIGAADQRAYCWGDPVDGIEDGLQTLQPRLTHLDLGVTHVCGTTFGGGAMCWGGVRDRSALDDQPDGSDLVEVAAGYFHNCARRADGSVLCWGEEPSDATYGQTIAPSGTFTQLTAGYHHTCGLHPGGTAQCWGNPDAY